MPVRGTHESDMWSGAEQSRESKNVEHVKVLSTASFFYLENRAGPCKSALCLCPLIKSLPFGLSCLQGASTNTTESLNKNIRAELKQGQ